MQVTYERIPLAPEEAVVKELQHGILENILADITSSSARHEELRIDGKNLDQQSLKIPQR